MTKKIDDLQARADKLGFELECKGKLYRVVRGSLSHKWADLETLDEALRDFEEFEKVVRFSKLH
jgi:hypothetical protein